MEPGTTISWYMKKKEPHNPANTDWVCGFSTSTGHRSQLDVRFPAGSNSSKGFLTAVLEESHYTALDQAPRDPLEVWDMEVLNSQGQVLTPSWSCEQGGYHFSRINCNWKDGSRSGVQITFGNYA
eukprot:TRINITY_DN6608_c0_g1_i1.p1 TRINITY_DN6608_c0_g1~~TRINITY_DN6608_c0_g1_i1.p1  ORF type:complete len:125 (+),score=20.40 TRINITY_DN6608_c0_g1_i1:190-564(+)